MASDRSISGSMETLSTTDNSSVNTFDSLTSSEFSHSGEDRQDNESLSQDTRSQWEVGELSPGSYCRYRYYPLQRKQREDRWNPKASKGIVVQRALSGCVDSQWTINSFSRDPKRFIQKIDTAANLYRERCEQFILLEVLPHLEELWGKCSESNKGIYKQLAMLSHCVNSGQVVRHSLRLLLHLICRDNFEKGHGSLLDLEEIVRLSIFTPQGVFRRDKQSERTLELLVYSRILLLLLRSVVLQGELLVVDLENDWKKVVEELKRHQKQVKNRKKDTLRYSMELIHALLSNYFLKDSGEISSKAERMKNFLEECKEFCGNPNKDSKDLKILQTLRDKKKTLEWDELHFILYHLHGKVHSERPTPQMETERRAMLLVGLITEAHVNAEGGEDWRFCLAASQLLVEIVKNNVTKELRQEAGFRLIYLLRDKKLQKKPECRAIVQKWSSQLLFSPNPEIRKIMIHFLSHNQREAEALPVERHSEHLSSIYGTQTLDITGAIISQNQNCVIVRGMFQQRKVVVKMLNVMKNHLLGKDPEFEARRRLINEAHNLRRLSASSHSNFPVLLGFDTKSMPYHIITAFECWENLQKFVQLQRDMESRAQPVHLLKMLDGVVCALLHLEELGLVHRCVNAENILVGDNFVCKLSGLHFLRLLSLEPTKQDLMDEGYCTPETPQYAATSTDMDPPVRWQAPESLMDHHFSTASDVYGFGVLVYEVLTYGCTPYRNISKDEEVFNRVLNHGEIVQKEDCFEDCEYMLIKQCCRWLYNYRPNFRDIQDQLGNIIDQQSDETKERPDPPPLKVDINASKCPIATVGEKVYDHIPDICEPPTLSSTEKSDDQQRGQYEDVLKDFFQTKHQGRTEIWERLSQQDIQHVKELRCLNNPHLVPILRDELFSSFRWIVSRLNYTYGSLKEYVLRRKCKREHIVMFLSQIASVCHYLHSKHIVHGNLTAICVYVEPPNKVQVGRLGRSKSLSKNPYEVTSTSCVVEAAMPEDASRRSSPEVNLAGHYTHASDVWAFGILAWELYQSFQHGENNPLFSIPYFWLDNDQILAHQRDSYPLDRPECCPDWVYILIHQCWAFQSEQRPPFLAIFDCLTSRKPMKSWIMKRWLETHKREEYPDLSITQGNDAFHVLPESCHPPEESIERMCSKGFFSQHKYKYVEDQTLEECGNPPASSPYEEQASKPPKKKSNLSVVDENFDIHVSSDKDNDPILPDGYEVYPSFSIHNKNQTGFPMETEYESPTEKKGNQVNLKEKGETQSNQSTTELQEQEGDEEDMYGPIAPSSDLAHNGDAILEEVRKQEQNADSVNTKYPSLTIHYKEPTGVPKEPRYQPLTEHSRNQADLTEKDETQSYQCRKTKLQHEQEGNDEVIYDFIAPSSDLGHNENVIHEQVRKQEEKAVKNASVEDAEKTKYPSFTIHYKEPTGVPKEREKQRPRERRGYEGGLTERDEEQSNPPKEKSNLSVDDKNFDIPVSSDEDNDHILPEGYENNILPKGYENKMYPSFSIHNKNQTGFPMETEYQYPAENRGNQVDLKEKGETQSNRSKTELQEQEGDEEDMCGPIAPSSALGHYENAGLEEVSKLDQTAAKNALVKDGVNTKYPSLTIHYKKPTGIPKEQGYQSPIEHRWNQADMTEKDKTQSYQCGKTKLQHEQEGNEEVIYDFIAPSSDLGHNENVILEQVRKQEEKAVKNASVEDAEKTKYPSFTIHYKEPTGVPKEREKQRPRERRGYEGGLTERDEEQSNPPKEKSNLSVDDKNFDIPVSSDEDNDHILPEGYENNILPKGYENKMYPSFSIHNKNQTGFPMETEYQYPAENRGNQVDLKDKGETQSNRSKTELQEQEGDEEDMCGPIAPSSALGHYENAGLEEVSKLDQTAAKNALVKDGVNTKYPSLTIHYKKPTGIPKEQGYQSPIEHRWNQADMTEKDKTQSYQCGKTKLQHEQEGNEEVIYDFIAPSSDLGHNENVILEQVRKQEEKAVKNASVEDAEKTKYPSFTIHYKEPTGVPKEREKQRPREHRGYEAVLTERGEEQSNPPKKKTKFQPRHKDDEGGINDYITISFRDSQKEQVDSNGNLEDEDEIARLGEICNQKQNVSQEETVRMTYSHEDDSGASEDVAHTLCTDNMKEEVHEAQNLQPAGEGTECKVDHQPSPFRRKSAIRRKRKSSETKKQAVPKANNKQNKENVTPEYDSQKEVLHEQDIKEVNEQHRAEEQNLSNEISPCLPLPATRGRDISMLPTRFAGIDIDLNTRIDDI